MCQIGCSEAMAVAPGRSLAGAHAAAKSLARVGLGQGELEPCLSTHRHLQGKELFRMVARGCEVLKGGGRGCMR